MATLPILILTPLIYLQSFKQTGGSLDNIVQ